MAALKIELTPQNIGELENNSYPKPVKFLNGSYYKLLNSYNFSIFSFILAFPPNKFENYFFVRALVTIGNILKFNFI